ncbi:hypothetical protein CONLIGDRAFT_181479 [Coniochaeta ligniaria NRRL 30616]|uniref:Uncharacterized protein n=1 Tax=Coniochaeta ligniaria NRRL 30616 TaxID=1408157 RepID=A0A1J7JJI4_9PEZI|nr:hypothetical protein CONLIGDRAFT_181479 [Coniochaeta ligniaria NRRL 30616]
MHLQPDFVCRSVTGACILQRATPNLIQHDRPSMPQKPCRTVSRSPLRMTHPRTPNITREPTSVEADDPVTGTCWLSNMSRARKPASPVLIGHSSCLYPRRPPRGYFPSCRPGLATPTQPPTLAVG